MQSGSPTISRPLDSDEGISVYFLRTRPFDPNHSGGGDRSELLKQTEGSLEA